MTPFERAVLPPATRGSLMQQFSLTARQAAEQLQRMREQIVFMNDTYQVNVTYIQAKPFGVKTGDIVWLSVKRLDKEAIHDWRDLQRIKNELVGPENEAFEIYPAESRLVDTANQYHLWCFRDPAVRLPVGFFERSVDGEKAAESVGAKQRPFTA